jgi:hypothetical protein
MARFNLFAFWHWIRWLVWHVLVVTVSATTVAQAQSPEKLASFFQRVTIFHKEDKRTCFPIMIIAVAKLVHHIMYGCLQFNLGPQLTMFTAEPINHTHHV